MTSKRKVKPVTVSTPKPWGIIGAFVGVAVLAAGIIGYGAFASWQGTRPWADRLTNLSGVTDYQAQKPAWLTNKHASGPLKYPVNPSVGGDHNGAWQNCTGDVYEEPIAAEHATHSLEHGAVWITYRPGLAAEQVSRLVERVRGINYTLMSPQPSQPTNVSLQAWGYQLGVDSADDSRIDEFLKIARVNAGLEPGAACSGGITATGTTPQDIGG